MKFLGLRSIVVKKYNHSGSSKTDDTKDYQNLLEQDFFAENQAINGLEILPIFIRKKQVGLI